MFEQELSKECRDGHPSSFLALLTLQSLVVLRCHLHLLLQFLVTVLQLEQLNAYWVCVRTKDSSKVVHAQLTS